MRQADIEECIYEAQVQRMKDFYEFDSRIELTFNKEDVTFIHGKYSFEFTIDEWYEWRDGKLIQDAFPSLNADEREMIMTGITPQEWDDLFLEAPDTIESIYGGKD